ncbi:hypothetical protein AB0K00_21470 [Dactylosporangium sp. NPDC049525]|uniref:hypothetical protein n=1 Tax=Dactylosporangium sp. NPDC049525 TaxID=3154730 RepID=UPI003437E73D
MPSRLWFRLDDVVPLAEHAMACTAHARTEAQTRAAAPLRPALTWTGTATLDILQSNGVPAWYGHNGTVHAAEAHTWRHTATGRYGTVNIDGYHHAYMPLAGGDGPGPRPIDSIREARETGRHWMWVDIDPADTHHIDWTRIGFTASRDEHVPADTRWLPAHVTCDAVAGAVYRAQIPDGYTTDAGHLLPRFDCGTVVQIVADLDAVQANPDRTSDVMAGEYPWLYLYGDGRGNALQISKATDDGTATTIREVDLVVPDADGCYSVGAYGWPWRLAS